ncbi:hypothetical protein E4U43_004671 [Claviceps pusilla]|uniref:Cyanovirin-N domain-containing protein n=1 Tax=Claviceps pusilla TaxID=123648 RepID=A0A9P7N331_9HYPO|nr:hypothetical protein E4U43_004671 [Claviceps pusilla]
MQFSTSTVLAAIAIFAGQTLAYCKPATMKGTSRACTTSDNIDWSCPDGTTIHNYNPDNNNEFIVTTKAKDAYINAFCTNDFVDHLQVRCTAGLTDALTLPCGKDTARFFINM